MTATSEITLRRCTICGETKALTLFEKKKDRPLGRGHRCSACMVQKAADYERRPEVMSRRLKSRADRYAAMSPEARAKRNRGGYLTWGEKVARYGEQKMGARVALSSAVRTGALKKPEACTRCGSKTRLQGHHADYFKPLDVEWLCTKCHGLKHRRRPYLPPEGP